MLNMMQKNARGLRMDNLNKKFAIADLTKYTNTTIQIIDERITKANETGQSEVAYKLDTIVTRNMMHDDAKIIIYSDLIKAYRDKGFTDISLKLVSDGALFIVRWKNKMTDEEREERLRIISSCLERPEKLGNLA